MIRRPIIFPYNNDKESHCPNDGCPRILLIDDDEFNILALKMMLRTFNLEVDWSLDSQQAIEMVVESMNRPCSCRYELILSDCNMPTLDGYETCKQLRKLIAEKKINDLNIIAVTADATQYNRKKCFQFGFDDVVIKPLPHD